MKTKALTPARESRFSLAEHGGFAAWTPAFSIVGMELLDKILTH